MNMEFIQSNNLCHSWWKLVPFWDGPCAEGMHRLQQTCKGQVLNSRIIFYITTQIHTLWALIGCISSIMFLLRSK